MVSDRLPRGSRAESSARARSHGWVYLGSGLVAALLFVTDLLLPRGPAPAIGYCAAVVLAGEARRPGYTLIMAVVCSLLTWTGHALEPHGTPGWMSILNRAMVMAVIWLTAILATLRQRAVRAVEQRTIELMRSNQELEQFAAVVSHDLRSPLMSIGGCAKLLKERLREHPAGDAMELLGFISESVQRMGDLITRVLHYARAGAAPLERRPCATTDVVERVLEDLRGDLENHGARVEVDRLPSVVADGRLLAQVFQNLIENAVKYRNREPPRIQISAHTKPDAWIFCVQDNGPGIAPEDRERIFQPFERGSRGEARPCGTGLGLATCRKIIEWHGGRLWIEPQRGDGSTFCFSLPRR